jgi:hypothetical protein
MPVRRIGGTGGKVAAIGAAVAGELGDVTRQLETPIDRNRGVTERVPLDAVRPDPQNPKNLGLTWEELKKGIAELPQSGGQALTERQKIFEKIAARAKSFVEVGQLQAIIVYRDERGILRIVDGENRYWAARLNDWLEIEAKIQFEKPRYLRRVQYAANALHDDLTLAQHLNNLQMILDEARQEGEDIQSLSQFANVVHRPRGTVQQWWAILRGPQDVKDAVRAGVVSSLDSAYTAAQERDDGRRRALLEGQILPTRNASSGSRPETRAAGRPKTSINLGNTRDLEIVKKLILSIPLDEAVDQVDWADIKAVQQTWNRFLAKLEKMSLKTDPKGKHKTGD